MLNYVHLYDIIYTPKLLQRPRMVIQTIYKVVYILFKFL